MADTEQRDEWAEWLKEFQEESDRACAILGAAMLDEQLRSLLEAFFVDDPRATKELLDSASAPVSTFSARVRMAYSLGFLAPTEKGDLELIRKTRNDFAHELHGLSFESAGIADRCSQLEGAKLYERLGLELDARTRYVFTVMSLATWIALRRIGIREGRRSLCPEVGRPAAPNARS